MEMEALEEAATLLQSEWLAVAAVTLAGSMEAEGTPVQQVTLPGRHLLRRLLLLA
jgi:hypothetical protein